VHDEDPEWSLDPLRPSDGDNVRFARDLRQHAMCVERRPE
jgi:hypothetical protein